MKAPPTRLDRASLPRYRLLYFDLPGRAEAIRLAFVLGKRGHTGESCSTARALLPVAQAGFEEDHGYDP